jgi:hypothetical protein
LKKHPAIDIREASQSSAGPLVTKPTINTNTVFNLSKQLVLTPSKYKQEHSAWNCAGPCHVSFMWVDVELLLCAAGKKFDRLAPRSCAFVCQFIIEESHLFDLSISTVSRGHHCIIINFMSRQ